MLIGHPYSYKNLQLFNLSLRCPIINHPSACEVDTFFYSFRKKSSVGVHNGATYWSISPSRGRKGCYIKQLIKSSSVIYSFLSTITYLNVHAVFTENILEYKYYLVECLPTFITFLILISTLNTLAAVFTVIQTNKQKNQKDQLGKIHATTIPMLM